MNILLRRVKIADPHSPFNNQEKDILIENGQIKKIGDQLKADLDQIFDEVDTIVSPGWVDPFVHFCDPGYEYKETLITGIQAAMAGGYTRVFTIPNTEPVTDNKAQVEYIKQSGYTYPCSVHPLGAVTKKADGKELAEMHDMRQSGAIAFSDGLYPIQSPGLFLKALQYVKAFKGIIIQLPIDKSIGAGGLINEGIVSTQLGLPGIPSLSEEIIIQRDLEILRYTQSRLHIAGVSTAKGIELISAARNEGLQVTCSVTPYHLFFCDEDLQSYDTNLKVNPPLRSKSDQLSLRAAVANGQVDCIASHHLPQDWDHKTCEFEYAEYGMTGLQTTFCILNEIFPDMSDQRLIELLSINTRKIFDLPTGTIKEGEQAEMTIFTRKKQHIFEKNQVLSKSVNTPFIGHLLHGKVMGTYYKKIFNQN